MNTKQLRKKFNIPIKEVSVNIEWFKGLLEAKAKLENNPILILNSDYHHLMGYIDSAKEIIKQYKIIEK